MNSHPDLSPEELANIGKAMDTGAVGASAGFVKSLLAMLDRRDRALAVLREGLNVAVNYMHHNTDDLCGDDLVGDGRRTMRFKCRIKEVVGALTRAQNILDGREGE